MGLDPNDLRLSIEAEVSAPGAQEAAEQIREAGRAADETLARFDRLRDTAVRPTTGEPVAPAFTVRPPQPTVEQPSVQVQPQVAPAPAPPPPARARADVPPPIVLQAPPQQPQPQPAAQPIPRVVVETPAPAPAPVTPPARQEPPVAQVATIAPPPQPTVQTAPQPAPPVATAPAPANPFALQTSPSPGAVALDMAGVEAHIQTLETQYTTNDARIEQLQTQLDNLRALRQERPPWATGMTQQGISGVAEHLGLNVNEPQWWDHIGKGDLMPEELSHYRGLGTQRQSGGGQSQADMRREVQRLKADQARILEASGNIYEAANDPAATFYLPPLANSEPLPWHEPAPAAPVRERDAARDQARGGVHPADAPARAAARSESAAEPAAAAAPAADLAPSPSPTAPPQPEAVEPAPAVRQRSRQDIYNPEREGGYRQGQTWVMDSTSGEFRDKRPDEKVVDRRDPGAHTPYFAVQRRGDKTAYVGEMYVPESMRGQGIGGRMYEHMAGWAADTGHTLVSGSDRSPLAERAVRGAQRRGLVDVVPAGEVEEIRRPAPRPIAAPPAPEQKPAAEESQGAQLAQLDREYAEHFAQHRPESEWARLGEHYQIHHQFHQRARDDEPEFPLPPALAAPLAEPVPAPEPAPQPAEQEPVPQPQATARTAPARPAITPAPPYRRSWEAVDAEVEALRQQQAAPTVAAAQPTVDATANLRPPAPAEDATPRPAIPLPAAAAPPAAPPPRPPAPPAAAPAPEPDPAPIRATAEAEQNLTRAISEDALATARAAGANESYIEGIRRVAEALLAQDEALTQTQALRQASGALGLNTRETNRLFPEDRRARAPGDGAAAAPAGDQGSAGGRGANGLQSLATVLDTVRQRETALVGPMGAKTAALDAQRQMALQATAALTGLAAALGGVASAESSAARLAAAPNARAERQRAPRSQVEHQRAEAGQDPGDTARRAAEGLEAPLERAHRSAGGLLSIFNLSAPSITRASLALFGVGAGLNALVTLARRVHEEMAAAIDAEVELAQRSREVRADFGPQQAPQLLAQASAFTANPTTRGNEQEYLAASTALHGLASEYSLNAQQIDGLTTAAGQLARIHNTELGPAVQAVQGVLRGNVDAAQQYGISLTDEYGRIRGLGATYEQLVGIYGRARAEQILYQQVLQQTAAQQANAAAPYDSTVSALDRLQKASELARQSLVHLGERPFNVIVNFASAAVEAIPRAAEIAREAQAARAADVAKISPRGTLPELAAAAAGDAFSTAGNAIGNAVDWVSRIDFSGRYPQVRPRPEPRSAINQVEAETGRGVRENEAAAAATRAATDAANEQSNAFQNLSVHIQGDLIPALERLTSIQRSISALGTIGQALRGPDVALTGGDIGRRASVQAAQDVLALEAQREAQQHDTTIDAARAVAPEEFARRQSAYSAVNQAELAVQLGGRGQAEAQAQVTTINLADQTRQLDVADDLARLRTESLGREGAIVDLQRQEANLADQQRVVARENLALLEQQTQARLASLDAVNRLNDLQYQERHTATEITAIRADVRRGALDPSALEAIPALRLQRRAERLATPRAELQAQEAQRPVELAQRATTQDQLQRTLQGIPLQEQQRALEDQLTPLQQAERFTAERTREIGIQLELAQLAETSERTAAELGVVSAERVVLAAEHSLRVSQDWAANINNGLTDIQRAWLILGSLPTPQPISGNPAPPALPASSTGQNPTPDRQPTAPIPVPEPAPRAANPTPDRQDQPPPPPPPTPPALPSPAPPPPPPAAADGGAQVAVPPPDYQNFPVVAQPQAAPPALSLDERLGPDRAPRGLSADQLDEWYRVHVEAPRTNQAAQDQGAVDRLNAPLTQQLPQVPDLSRPADVQREPAGIPLDAAGQNAANDAFARSEAAAKAAASEAGDVRHAAMIPVLNPEQQARAAAVTPEMGRETVSPTPIPQAPATPLPAVETATANSAPLQEAQSIRAGVRRGELDPSALDQIPALRAQAHQDAGQARIQAHEQARDSASSPPLGGSSAQAATATQAQGTRGGGGGSNDTYTITVQVGGSNATPADIGRAVVAALNARQGRAVQAQPRGVGSR